MSTIDAAAYVKLESRVKELEAQLSKLKGNAASSPVSAIFPIDSKSAGVGGAASFDFQNIPATYSKLILDLYARGDTAATYVTINAKFNNDGSALYDYLQWSIHYNAALITIEGLAQVSMFIGTIAAATAPASTFDLVSISIPQYANTHAHKVVESSDTVKLSTTTTNLYAEGTAGWYRSANAINRITVTPSAGNFAQYSTAQLYGVL